MNDTLATVLVCTMIPLCAFMLFYLYIMVDLHIHPRPISRGTDWQKPPKGE